MYSIETPVRVNTGQSGAVETTGLSLKIVTDESNPLLQRREVICTFKASAGLMTRQEAVKAVAKKLRIDAENVYLIALQGKSGTRDISGRFYVLKDEIEAKKQLPKHLFLRLLSREERKGLAEQAKKAKPAEPEKKK